MERSAGLLERHARRGEDFPHAGAVAVQLDVKLVERSSEADELILWVDHCIVGEKKGRVLSARAGYTASVSWGGKGS